MPCAPPARREPDRGSQTGSKAAASRRKPWHDEVPDPVGEHLLGRALDFRHLTIRGEHDRGVLARPESPAVTHLVDDEQVATLAGELPPRGRQHVVGFRSETDDNLTRPLPLRGQFGKNVRIFCERDRLRELIAFLYLRFAARSGAVVGHSSGHDLGEPRSPPRW